jgi:hypothetical protein
MRTPCSCSPLCRTTSQPDYTFDDGAGHTYYANICGVSKHRCLPPDWLATYEIGVAVQFFGDTPPCNYLDPATLTCVEKVGQTPTCCTADCQVLGVGEPTYVHMRTRTRTRTPPPPPQSCPPTHAYMHACVHPAPLALGTGRLFPLL